MTKTYIDELAEEIAKLRQQNNKLNEMCNYWSIEETERTMECYKLKQLLKECREYVVNTPVYPQGDDNKQAEIHILVDKINEALK